MTVQLALAAVSYNLDGAAAASGISRRRIQDAIAADELVAYYNGDRPVVTAADLYDWVRSLPTERPKR